MIEEESVQYLRLFSSRRQSPLLILSFCNVLLSLYQKTTGAENGESNQQPPTEVDELEDSSSSASSTFRWHSWLRIPEFYHVTLLYVCSRLAITLSSTFIVLTITDSYRMAKIYGSILPLVSFVAGVVPAICLRFSGRLVGHHAAYVKGAVFLVAAAVWFHFVENAVGEKYDAGIFGAVTALGFGLSILTIVSMSFVTEMIGDRVTSAGFVYGFVSTVEKVITGVTIYIADKMMPGKIVSTTTTTTTAATKALTKGEAATTTATPNPYNPSRAAYLRKMMVWGLVASAALAIILAALHWLIFQRRRRESDEIDETTPLLAENRDRGKEEGEDEDEEAVSSSGKAAADSKRRSVVSFAETTKSATTSSSTSTTSIRKRRRQRTESAGSMVEKMSFRDARGASIVAYAEERKRMSSNKGTTN